jgi:Carboxypeptidase regulatory-like domain
MSARLGFCAILMTLLFGGTVMAQQAQLSGFVRDPRGAVVAKATVTVRSVSTNAERSSNTDGSGSYTFPLLAAGIYQATAGASGFEKKIIENVAIEVAAKATLNIDLTVGATTDTVIVSGGQLLVNTTDASVSTMVNRQFVENLPLNGRSFQSLLTLVPDQGNGIAYFTAGYSSRYIRRAARAHCNSR